MPRAPFSAPKARLLALALSLPASLVALELGLRLWDPPLGEQVGLTLQRGRASEFERLYRFDAELGFVPRTAEHWYAEHGAKPNAYDPSSKPEGVQRIAFLGDSVAQRGRIQAALERRLARDGRAGRFELWNFGVESYTTRQEVGYYRRFARATRPDLVVLLFHLNDFTVTPLLFKDAAGDLVSFTPRERIEVSARWWRWSRIYRLWISERLRRSTHSEGLDAAEAEVRDALAELAAMARADGARLAVLVLPAFGGVAELPEEWRAQEGVRKDRIRRLLDELGIEGWNLQEPHDRALAAGVPVRETPADMMHPSDEVAGFIADYLVDETALLGP